MTTILNDSYLSQPITVPQGGSGLSTTTAYGLLAGGTTTTALFQNAGTGTTGQVYVGASGALGTWTNQNALGSWVLISTQTASNSANISFTGLSTSYNAYKISISAVVPATNATNFEMLVSSNNGVSYDNSASNYSYTNFYVADTGTATDAFNNSTAATNIRIGNAWSNTATWGSNLEVMFVDPATSYVDNGIWWAGKYNDSTSAGCWVGGAGSRVATQINNAVRFLFSSGNISSGVFKLYGLQT